MSKVTVKIEEEFYAVLPPTIFFFFALHLVAFIRVLMAKGTGIAPLFVISIAIAALILGKAVLMRTCFPSLIAVRTNR
jgi:hypothetical protein